MVLRFSAGLADYGAGFVLGNAGRRVSGPIRRWPLSKEWLPRLERAAGCATRGLFGFDKEHTVAVLAGNFDSRPMRDTFAVRAATPLWAAVMQELLRRDHPLDPPVENERLVRREICKTTGFLPSCFSPAKLSELFLAGTEPCEDSSDCFASDGKRLLPDEYSRWCASRDNNISAHVRSDFRITSPPLNAHYEIDPVLPSSVRKSHARLSYGMPF